MRNRSLWPLCGQAKQAQVEIDRGEVAFHGPIKFEPSLARARLVASAVTKT